MTCPSVREESASSRETVVTSSSGESSEMVTEASAAVLRRGTKATTGEASDGESFSDISVGIDVVRGGVGGGAEGGAGGDGDDGVLSLSVRVRSEPSVAAPREAVMVVTCPSVREEEASCSPRRW